MESSNKSEINAFDRIRGALVSTKNGQEFHLLYEYYKAYNAKIGSDVYYFDIWQEGDESKVRFSYMLRVMENGADLKVIDLFANGFVGKGISIAIILKSKELFKKRIFRALTT